MTIRKKWRKMALPVFLLLSLSVAQAASSIGTTGFEFLRTEVNPRATGMAGAFVSIPGDISGISYNPALMSGIQNMTASISYLNHILDLNSGSLIGAKPLKWGYLGGFVDYMNYGEFTRTTREDPEGASGETFGANSVVAGVSAAMPVHRLITVGSTIKYIHSGIDSYSAGAVALDFGAYMKVPLAGGDFFNLGISLANIGTATQAFIDTKDDLPLVYRIGVSKSLAHLPLMISAQGYQYQGDDIRFAVGGEFSFSPRMVLRLGYNSIGMSQKTDTSGDKLAGFNLGVGFNWKTYRL
ncbi:PorV/PorQ family protein, partial [bacterium]|nr:PorV/PorQ family protein [bacterium]